MSTYTLYVESIAMCIILLVVLFIANSYNRKTRGLDSLSCIYILSIITASMDVIWVNVDGVVEYASVNLIINTIYLIIFNFIGYCWFAYVCNVLPERFVPSRRVRLLLLLIPVISGILVFFSQWNHLIFYIDSYGIYHRAQWYIIQPFTDYLFLLLGSILSLNAMVKTEDKLERRLYGAMAMFVIPASLSQIIQVRFSLSVMTTYLGIFLSLFIMFYYQTFYNIKKNETDRFRELSVAAALGKSYELVAYADFDNSEISVFRIEGVFKKYEKYINNGKMSPFLFDKFLKEAVAPDMYADFVSYVDFSKIQNEMERGHDYSTDVRIVDDNIDKWYRLLFTAGENFSNLVVGFVSIEDEKKHELELERASKMAEEASKSKSAFLFNMSHDIRTPINAILGFTEMSKKNLENREKLADCLNKVTISGNHLLSLINNILDIARIENNKIVIEKVPTDVTELLEEIEIMISADAHNNKIVYNQVINSVENRYVNADRLHVKQILINILNNAMKFTEAGGHVTFSVEQLADTTDGKAYYSFIISDDGIGMSKEFQSHLFEEFGRERTSTQSGVEGTGLGMAIVKNLAELMDGRIEVDSIEGQGTSVSIYLSFDKCTQEDIVKENEDAVKDVGLSGLRVLLVEDNDLNREISRDVLNDLGIVVEEAVNGKEAVNMVKSNDSYYYDLILMDLQMPVMDGYEATALINNINSIRKIPIIALSANAFEEDKAKSTEAGMVGHLSKPINPKELTEMIARFISV